MDQGPKSLQKWILIVSGFFALLELVAGISLWIAPASFLDTVDLNAKGVGYVIQMWATRQFALGFMFGFATIKRSTPMLTIAYIFFLVMFIGDFVVGISQHENPLMISASIMCVISAAMLVAINKRK